MPTTQIAPSLIQSFRDSNGNPLAGGSLYTYAAGTSTPQATYIDQTGVITNANPVILNNRGEAPVWLTTGQSYKFALYDYFGTLIYSVDQVVAPVSLGSPVTLAASGITGAAASGPLSTSGITGAAASGANADITSLTGPVSTVNGQTLLHTNDVINGNFVIAQIGTSFPAPVAGAYDLDGWMNSNSTTAVFTVAQAAGSTAGRLSRQVTITTAKTVVAAGDYVADLTRIEGYNIEKYVGKTFTIGFRAIVPVVGIHCVAVRNSAGDRSYIAEINFPTANVWQNCSFTVVGGLPTGGTWNYTNAAGLELWFGHLCGTTFQTTPGAWQTGNFLGTANQANDCASLTNVWGLEKVTLNLGTVAAVSEISYEAELGRCMRYLPVISAPAVDQALGTGSYFSATVVSFVYNYIVPPRISPTGIAINSLSALKFYSNGGSTISSNVTFNTGTTTAAWMLCTTTGIAGAGCAVVANGIVLIQFTGCRL